LTPRDNPQKPQFVEMSTTKRKAVDSGLQRRVRARRESSEELEEAGSVPSLNGDQPTEDEDEKIDEDEEV
jgi:ribosomal RNA-processing protein 36